MAIILLTKSNLKQQKERPIFLNPSALWSIVGYFIVVLGLSFGIFFVIRDFQNLNIQMLELNLVRLLLSFFISLLSMFLAVLIWRSILQINGVNHDFKHDLKVYVYSLLGYMLPGGVWTILVRGFLSKKDGTIKTPLTVMAGVVETILNGISALSLCILFLFLQNWSVSLPLTIPLLVGIIMLFILDPKIFTRLTNWFVKLTNKNYPNTYLQFTYSNLLLWFFGELLVIIIGSLALFVLLSSFLEVNLQILVLMIISWSFAVAISSLFFWLPGTPFIRDGTMVGILSTNMTLGFAILFVVVQRLWSIITILLFSLFLWIIFDLPKLVTKIKLIQKKY